jgi:hypothetical protein
MEIACNAKSMKRELSFIRGAWCVSTTMTPRPFQGRCIDVATGAVWDATATATASATAGGGHDGQLPLMPVCYVVDGVISHFEVKKKLGDGGRCKQVREGVVGIRAEEGVRNARTAVQWAIRLVGVKPPAAANNGTSGGGTAAANNGAGGASADTDTDTDTDKLDHDDIRRQVSLLHDTCTAARFTASTFSSMMQKLVRLRAPHCACMFAYQDNPARGRSSADILTTAGPVPESESESPESVHLHDAAAAAPHTPMVDSRVALIYCMQQLLDGPGHFVPR